MRSRIVKQDIAAGYRPIRDGREYNRYFAQPEEQDQVIIEDGEVEQTVDLMKKVVWRYLDDTREIAKILKGSTLKETCRNTWNFLYHHIQYKLDKKGLEQLRRPCRSWAERKTGIDCDCFSIFVSSILTNLQILHRFRIAKYNQDVFQHVYVVVPCTGKAGHYTIDCVVSEFNYEKPFKQNKDFAMSLNGINVAVLSGTSEDVMDLVSGLEGLDGLGAGEDNSQLILEHLKKTRNLVAEKPQLVESVDYPPAFLKMLDYAIESWNTPNRDKALEILAKNEEALNQLNGFDGELDPELDGLDEDIMDLSGLGVVAPKKPVPVKPGAITKPAIVSKPVAKPAAKPKKKGFFAKVGEAVKKGGKAFVRFNPVTISARGGFLVALKLNIKKMGSKLKWGYATKEQAAAKGVSQSDWEKSKSALAKVEKLFVDKLQGKKSAMKNAILMGKAGGLNGVEDDSFEGLGVLPAVALAAAVPVITSALKIMVDSGVMKKEEADNIQAEVNQKATEANKYANDPDIQDEGTTSGEPPSSGPEGNDGEPESKGGIVGFVKKQPLLAIGGAALGIWGISKMMQGGNKTKGKAMGFVPKKSSKRKHKGSKSRGKSKIKAITLS
ncbi:MAG: hypothetical protein U0T82_11900 [Bacteroidales bacterium]